MNFGSDGFEREAKALKRQLNEKDIQVSSIQNELYKLKETCEELKRAKEEAVYRLGFEAENANKVSESLTKTTAELKQYKLRVANADRALLEATESVATSSKLARQADLRWELEGLHNEGGLDKVREEKAKLEVKCRELEKDVVRLKADLDRAGPRDDGGGFFGGFGESSKSGSDKNKLLDLENEVLALKAQNIKLEEEARLLSSSLGTSSAFGSPDQQRLTSGSGHRRRSTSLSSSANVASLEAELVGLRSLLTESEAQLEPLRTKLSTAQKAVLRLENEKMALERSTARATEELKADLCEARDELEGLREVVHAREGASDELERAKREAARERESLEGDLKERAEAVRRLEARVQEQEEEIERERDNLREAEERIKALKAEAKAPPSVSVNPDVSAVADPSADQAMHHAIVARFEARIIELEGELSTSLAAAGPSDDLGSSMTRSTSDRSLSHETEAEVELAKLQKELNRLKRDKKNLEDDLAASDELVAEKDREIRALQNNIPLPSSPSPASGEISPMDVDDSADRLAELEAQLEDAQATSEAVRAELAKAQEAILGLEREVKDGLEREETANSDLRKIKAEYQIYQGEMEAFTSQRDAFEADLQTAQECRETSQTEVTRLLGEVDRLQADLSTVQSESTAAMAQREETLGQLALEKLALEARVKTLEVGQLESREAGSQVAALEEALLELQAHRSVDDSAVEEIRQQKVTLTEELQWERERAKELEMLQFGAEQERNDALADADKLRAALETLEEQMQQEMTVSSQQMTDFEEQETQMKATLASLHEEIEALRFQLAQSEASESASSRRCEELNDLHQATLSACVEAETQISQLEENLRERDQQLIESRTRAEALKEMIAELRREQEFLETEHQQTISSLVAAAATAREEVGIKLAEKDARIASLSHEFDAKLAEIAELKGKLAAGVVQKLSEEERSDLEVLLGRLRRQRDDLAAEKEELQLSLSFSTSETTVLNRELSSARKAAKAESEQLDQMRIVSGEATALAQSLQEQLDSVQASIAEHVAKSATLAGEVESSTVRLAAVQEEKVALEAQAESTRVALEVAQADLQARSEALKELQETAAAKEAEAASVDKERTAWKEEEIALQARVKRRTDTVTTQQHEITRLKSVLGMTQENLDDLATELEELTVERDALLAQGDEHTSARQNLQTQLDAALASTVTLEATLAAASPDETLKTSLQASQSLVRELEDSLATSAVDHDAAEASLRQELATAKASLQELEFSLASALKEHHEANEILESEVRTLKSSLERTTATNESLTADILGVRESSQSEMTALISVVFSEKARVRDLTLSLDQLSGARAELDVASHEKTTLTERISSLSSDLERVAADLVNANEKVNTLDLDLAQRTFAIADLEVQAAELNELLGTSTVDLGEKEKELAVARDEVLALTRDLAGRSDASDTLGKTVEELTANLVDRDSQIEVLRAQFDGLASTGSELEDTLRSIIAEKESDISSLRAELEFISDELASHTKSAAAQESDLEAHTANITARDAQIEELRSQCASLNEATARQEAALRQAQEELVCLSSAHAKLSIAEENVARLEREAHELSAVADESAKAISTLEAKLSDAENVELMVPAVELSALRLEREQALTDLTESKAQLEALQSVHHEIEAALATSREAEEGLRSQSSSNEEKIAACETEISTLQAAQAALIEAEQLARDLANSATSKSAAALAEAQAFHTTEFQALRDEFATIQTRLAEAEQTNAGLTTDLAVRSTEKTDLERSLANVSAQLKSTITELQTKETDLASIRAASENSQSELSERDERITALSEDVQRLEGERVSLADQLASQMTLLEAANTQISDKEIALDTTTQKVQRLTDQVTLVEDKFHAAEDRLGRQKARHDKEIADAADALEKATAAIAGEGDAAKIMDLEDHIQRLIASLEAKNAEIEENDDKVIGLLKEQKVYKRKIEILTKKLEKASANAAPRSAVSATAAAPAAPAAVVEKAAAPLISTVPPVVIPASTSSSARPIASSRRVSGGAPSPTIAPMATVTSPVAQTTTPSILSPPASLKRSRPQDLEPPLQPLVTAVASPSAVPALASAAPPLGTPRQRLSSRGKTPAGSGFTPQRSALRPAPVNGEQLAVTTATTAAGEKPLIPSSAAAAVASAPSAAATTAGSTLGKLSEIGGVSKLRGNSDELLGRLAAMRRTKQ